MASYIYYVLDESVLLDTTYDKLAKALDAHWDEFDHPHKHLVDRADLSATTLFKLKPDDYPMMVRRAAEIWLREVRACRRGIV